MTPLEAAGASRFHHQLLPRDLVTFSPSMPLPNACVLALGDLGYRALPHDWEFGNVQVILRSENDLHAASDPRGRGQSRVLLREDRRGAN